MVELGADNPDLYIVSADLKTSLGLSHFAQKYPKRFIECGVAENNAAGVAAGLAKAGKTVFLCSFACFSPAINWATIKQSIAYNKLNVKIVGSHAGLMTAELGATHQMLEDVAIMRAMPNMEVLAPIDAVETEKIMRVVARSQKSAYLRLAGPESRVVYNSKLTFTIGKSYILQKGKLVTVIGYGPIVIQALELSDLRLEIINCSSIKPLDGKTILDSVRKTGRLICLEDHQKQGGLGEAVAGEILAAGITSKFSHLGVNNSFGQSARDYRQLYDDYGIGIKSLKEAIEKIL